MIIDSFTLWAMGHTLAVVVFLFARCRHRGIDLDQVSKHSARRPYRA